jgi:hypothetical protein
MQAGKIGIILVHIVTFFQILDLGSTRQLLRIVLHTHTTQQFLIYSPYRACATPQSNGWQNAGEGLGEDIQDIGDPIERVAACAKGLD